MLFGAWIDPQGQSSTSTHAARITSWSTTFTDRISLRVQNRIDGRERLLIAEAEYDGTFMPHRRSVLPDHRPVNTAETSEVIRTTEALSQHEAQTIKVHPVDNTGCSSAIRVARGGVFYRVQKRGFRCARESQSRVIHRPHEWAGCPAAYVCNGLYPQLTKRSGIQLALLLRSR